METTKKGFVNSAVKGHDCWDILFYFYHKNDGQLQEFQQSSRCWLRDQKQKNPAISHFHDLKSPTYYPESDIYSKALLLCLSMSVECHAFLEQLSFCQNAKRWEGW